MSKKKVTDSFVAILAGQGAVGPSVFVRPKVVCPDGFVISVQASRVHYCSPREDVGPWYLVECGYPSERPKPWTGKSGWKQYAETPSDPTGTVYGWVPVEMVEWLLRSHGWTPENPVGEPIEIVIVGDLLAAAERRGDSAESRAAVIAAVKGRHD
jgi:hypothetical protein